jgi:flavin reductase (DIM6/NTAB) family NADH-FMN oxidoreductase RutF
VSGVSGVSDDTEREEAFGRLASALDPPMAVVTTVADGERAGCLVGFHAQCSVAPARYVVWLSKANHTHRIAMRSEVLAVHFLDRSQRELAELFGGTSGDDHDKFERCEWAPGLDGVPVLTACPHHVIGRRVALLDEGSDHVCVVVHPVEVGAPGGLQPMRLSDAADIDPGHEAEERPAPPTERAG